MNFIYDLHNKLFETPDQLNDGAHVFENWNLSHKFGYLVVSNDDCVSEHLLKLA